MANWFTPFMEPYPPLGQTWGFPVQVCLAMPLSDPSDGGNTNVGMLGKAAADDTVTQDIKATTASE